MEDKYNPMNVFLVLSVWVSLVGELETKGIIEVGKGMKFIPGGKGRGERK